MIAIGLFVGATLYVEALPSQYEGVAVVAYAPRADVPTAGADTVRLVVPKYVSFLASPQTRSAVAGEIGLRLEDLQGALEASPGTDSGNLEIAVTLTSPSLAARAANAFAEAAIDFSEGDELVRGELVAAALTPTEPAGPPRRLFEAASLLVGVLLGIVVSLLLERARPRVRSWRDIYRISGLTVVGRIPRSRTLKSRPTEGFTDPIVGAAFRNLRTNVERAAQGREEELGVVVVASATSGDGKTTVACLFAEALARLGRRVLLVDGDLHRPNMSRMLRREISGGLAAVLRQEVSLADEVEAGWTDNLDILATRADPQGGDLVANRFALFLTEARKTHDVIVVDTPPLLGTDEGRTIATLATGVLFVVRAGTVTGPVNEGILALEALKVPMLGAVGNALRHREVGQYYA